MNDDAREAGAREADRLGPVVDPDVLERVARILRQYQYATNGRRAPAAAVITDSGEGPPDVFND
jgi:hypothetical protein